MRRSNVVAVIANHKEQDSQAILSEAAADLRRAGARVVGVLAENSDVEGTCSAAFLRDLASGRRFSIQLDTAPAGTTCHLDTAGIDEACAELLPQMTLADVVVLSKFGKTEAMGRGLRAAFSNAIAAGKPVLTTVSPKHVEAWLAFAPDAAWLEPDSRSIQQWWRTATARIP
jgi:nucleoside-triphosphatase THEP1